MGDDVVYNIEVERLADYQSGGLVVRTARPRVLVGRLSTDDIGRLAYLQLRSLPADITPLIHWAEGLAIEIVLERPAADFAQLYRYAKLLDNHPVRVFIPVVTGFEQAVKLALSLQFSVRLGLGQPDSALLEPLARLLDDYLHRPAVAQPVELFHYLLLAFCHDRPLSLWAVQEEDPALLRYVDDRGVERLPGRLYQTDAEPAGFVDRWRRGLVDAGAECAGCAFVDRCQGYFKWPERGYDCAGIKTLLQTLHQAGAELRGDLAAATATARGTRV